MALLVRCKCGKKLRIPATAAGRMVVCPNCQKQFRISPEKFHDARSRVASLEGGGGSREPPSPPPAVEPQPVALDIEPVELDLQPASLDGATGALLTELEADAAGAAPRPNGVAPRVVEIETTVELDYAAGDTPPGAAGSGGPGDEIARPRRGYWADAFSSFGYPFRNVTNLFSFVFIALLACMRFPLAYAPIIGAVGAFFIFGWLAAVYLSTVRDTASGSDEMPGIKIEEGFVEDILKPAFRFIGSFAVALLPAVTYGLLIAFGVPLPGLGVPVMMAIGVFFWPIIVIMFALGFVQTLARLDLIVTTILRSILPYLATWLMLGVVLILFVATTMGSVIASFGVNLAIPDLMSAGIVARIFLEVVQTYLFLVAMRLIGLFYLHFKDRFTVSME